MADSLEKVAGEVRVCPKCPLSKSRTLAVPGEGPANARVMFIGEGPGFHEDRQGRPFVGPSGQYLEFITNVVKCRPPGNRDPEPNEIAACREYLDRQLTLIKPSVVVTLGRFSMERFFPGQSITRIHGKAKRVSIFMNVFNVHVNRYPASGTVRFVHYNPGRFLNAATEKSSLEK